MHLIEDKVCTLQVLSSSFLEVNATLRGRAALSSIHIMKHKITLPKKVTIGAFDVELVLVSHELSYHLAEQQGAFVSNPPYKIYLDEDIIEAGGKDALNLVLHEMMHVGYYQYCLKDKDEEGVVNAFGNFLTELMMRSELRDWIFSFGRKM